MSGQGNDFLVVHILDANGEEHGRKLFAWALEIPGVVDNTQVLNLRGFSELQGAAVASKGRVKAWTQAMMLPRITEEIVLDAFAWYERVRKGEGSVAKETYFIFELFSTVSNTVLSSGFY